MFEVSHWKLRNVSHAVHSYIWIKTDNGYEFQDDGRHRVAAARELGYDIPVNVIERSGGRNNGDIANTVDENGESGRDGILAKIFGHKSENVQEAQAGEQEPINQILQTPEKDETLVNQILRTPEQQEPLYEQSLVAKEMDEGKELEDIKRWVKEINPNFDEFDTESPYSNNCGSCAYSVFKRFNGDHTAVASSQNIPTIAEMNAATGMVQKKMSPGDIQRYLLAKGKGANAIIGVDRSMGAGHWFNAWCDGKKVYAIDGQTGTVSDWPPDYGNVTNWDMSVKEEKK